MKNADMFHKAIYYYLAKLEPLWNQYKKVGTICDTKRHSSSHSHTSRDNKKCVTRDTPPPYSRHSDFRGPKTRGPSSFKSHINKRHCRSPDKFKSRRRVDSGSGELPASSEVSPTRTIPRSLTTNMKSSRGGSDGEKKNNESSLTLKCSDRDRGNIPSSSQILTATFKHISKTSNELGRGILPTTPQLMPKHQKPLTSCRDNELSFKLKCAERGRGNIPPSSHIITAPFQRKPKTSNESGRGILPTNTQLIPKHEKKVSTCRGWGRSSNSTWPNNAINKDKGSAWDKPIVNRPFHETPINKNWPN
jgi:hypothetical protein